jgi:tetratricopeptide (TPR) repeat protein
MSTPNIEETSPNQIKTITENTAPVSTGPQPEKKTKPRRGLWILLGCVIILAGIGLGFLLGSNAGIGDRLKNMQGQVAMASTEQFQLGLLDQKAGRFEAARKRFEYVIQLNPNFPGVADKLAEVMIAQATTATPTPAPTATQIPVTPTPDTRGEEELYNNARMALAAKDWQKTVDTLDSLRKLNKTYRAIEVDGMYYVSLRNRGLDKVRRGQLEEGMYDMSLTERFGPLDKEADTYRTWSRLYVTGASFWEIDWVQVINYFSQVYSAVPMMRDGSGMTSADRYHKALIAYGEQLVGEGNYCDAEQQYALAMQIGTDNSAAKKATEVYTQCHPESTDTPPPPTSDVAPTSEGITPIAPTTEVLPSKTPVTPVPVDPTTVPPPVDPSAPAPFK